MSSVCNSCRAVLWQIMVILYQSGLLSITEQKACHVITILCNNSLLKSSFCCLLVVSRTPQRVPSSKTVLAMPRVCINLKPRIEMEAKDGNGYVALLEQKWLPNSMFYLKTFSIFWVFKPLLVSVWVGIWFWNLILGITSIKCVLVKNTSRYVWVQTAKCRWCSFYFCFRFAVSVRICLIL